jgi:hypothetical protein
MPVDIRLERLSEEAFGDLSDPSPSPDYIADNAGYTTAQPDEDREVLEAHETDLGTDTEDSPEAVDELATQVVAYATKLLTETNVDLETPKAATVTDIEQPMPLKAEHDGEPPKIVDTPDPATTEPVKVETTKDVTPTPDGGSGDQTGGNDNQGGGDSGDGETPGDEPTGDDDNEDDTEQDRPEPSKDLAVPAHEIAAGEAAVEEDDPSYSCPRR